MCAINGHATAGFPAHFTIGGLQREVILCGKLLTITPFMTQCDYIQGTFAVDVKYTKPSNTRRTMSRHKETCR